MNNSRKHIVESCKRNNNIGKRDKKWQVSRTGPAEKMLFEPRPEKLEARSRRADRRTV